MQNSIGGIYFFRFWSKIPLLGKFGPKNQNSLFILEFDT